MFLHLFVSDSVHGGVWQTHTPGQTPPPWVDTAPPPTGQTPLPSRHPTTQSMLGYTPLYPVHAGIHPHRQPLQWTVCILLECILVHVEV